MRALSVGGVQQVEPSAREKNVCDVRRRAWPLIPLNMLITYDNTPLHIDTADNTLFRQRFCYALLPATNTTNHHLQRTQPLDYTASVLDVFTNTFTDSYELSQLQVNHHF